MARIVCLIETAEPSGAKFTWSDGPDIFKPYVFDRHVVQGPASLSTWIDAVRSQCGVLVWLYLKALADPAGARQVAAREGFKLAAAGSKLRKELFRITGKDKDNISAVVGWLKRMVENNAVDSLEFVVAEEALAVPWGLLYDAEPDEKAFLSGDDKAWESFWGLKFNLACGQQVDPRRRMPMWDKPQVLLVIDPKVFKGLPKAEQDRTTEFARARELTIVKSKSDLSAALAARRPDILYWLGHATPKGLILGELKDRQEITPKALSELLEGEGNRPRGGLVFLNACQTAQRPGPDEGGSFIEAVFGADVGGLIATEQQTVDTFAAPFGLDFLEKFLDGGKSVGEVMSELRRRVPLGLVYGTYCPPEIRVVRPGAVVAQAAVNTTAPAPGVALGAEVRSVLPAPAQDSKLPEHPYRSLRAYGRNDRALFAGRDDDVARFAQVLDDPGARVLLLHGESGVGKTSFLRAGVIPFLETECIGYRFARDASKPESDALLLVRATRDPVSQIADTLNKFCAAPYRYRTPAGKQITADLPAVLKKSVGDRTGPDALRQALRADFGLLGRLLNALADKLPFTPVLVIDQAEEVFTLARPAGEQKREPNDPPTDEENRKEMLEMLRLAATGPGGFKLVVSLRTEYHGRFVDRLRKGTRDAGGVRDYLLTDFGTEALTEVIRRPASITRIPYSSEVPAEKYGFRFADEVAEEIALLARASTINRQDSVLPLVQVICTQLYDMAKNRPDTTITRADLDAIGGFEGAMKRHAEEAVRRLFSNGKDQRAFKHLLADDETQLFRRQADGTLTTELLPADFLERHWTGRMPFKDALKAAEDGDWRLLRPSTLRLGSDDGEREYVSLGHDALAKVVSEWDAELTRWRRLQRWVAAVALSILVSAILAAALGYSRYQLDRAHQAELAQAAAQQKTQRSLARSLINSVGHGFDHRLQPIELDTVWELATLELHDEPVRVEFLRTAFRSPDSAKRFSRRADLVTHAAVGLDARRRQLVAREILIPALSSESSSPEAKLAAAEAGVALDLTDPDFLRLAFPVFAGQVQTSVTWSAAPDKWPLRREFGKRYLFLLAASSEWPLVLDQVEKCEGRELSQWAAGVNEVLGRLPPNTAATTARRVVVRLARTTDHRPKNRFDGRNQFVGLLDEELDFTLKPLTGLLDAPHACVVADVLVGLVEHSKPGYEGEVRRFCDTLGLLAPHLAPADAARLADLLAAVAGRAPDGGPALAAVVGGPGSIGYRPRRELFALQVLGVLVRSESLGRADAARVCKLAADYVQSRLKAGITHAYDLRPVYEYLAVGMAPEDAAELGRQLEAMLETEQDSSRRGWLITLLAVLDPGPKSRVIDRVLSPITTASLGPNTKAVTAIAGPVAVLVELNARQQQKKSVGQIRWLLSDSRKLTAATGRVCARATDHFLGLMAEENAPDRLSHYADCLSETIKGLTPDDAGRVARRILTDCRRIPAGGPDARLWQDTLSRLAEQIAPAHAGPCADELVAIARDDLRLFTALAPAPVLEKLLRKTDPKEAARISTLLLQLAKSWGQDQTSVAARQAITRGVMAHVDTPTAERLMEGPIRGIAQADSNQGNLGANEAMPLARLLDSPAASRMLPRVLSVIRERQKKIGDVEYRIYDLLDALAGQFETAEANAAVSNLLAVLDADVWEWERAGRGFAILARRTDAATAAASTDRLYASFLRHSDSRDLGVHGLLDRLALSLNETTWAMTPAQADRWLGVLLRSPAFEFPGITDRVDLGTDLAVIVHHLKAPTCVGRIRETLLRNAGSLAGQRFGTVWEFESWARANRPDLDFTSPPRR